MDPKSATAGTAALAGRVMLGLLGVHLLVSPLLLDTGTPDPFETPKAALLQSVAVALLAVAAWQLGTRWLTVRPPDFVDAARRDVLAVGFALFALSVVLSTFAAVSVRTAWHGDPESWAGLRTLLAYVVLFFATRAAGGDAPAARTLLACTVPATALLGVYALVQAVGWDPMAWVQVSNVGSYHRPFATLGHANSLAAFLAMTFPVVCWFAAECWQRRRRPAALGLGAVALLTVVALVLTLSRGGWLALGCAGGVLLLPVFRRGFSRRHLTVIGIGAIPVALVLVAVLATNDPVGGALSQRLRRFADPASRNFHWAAGWQMGQERPWLGVGPDNFRLTYPQWRSVETWSRDGDCLPARAHNIAVQLFATQGMLGSLAGLLIVGGIVQAARRAVRSQDASAPGLCWPLLAGIGAFAVQGSFHFAGAAVGTVFVTYVAILSRCAARDPSIDRPTAPAWQRGARWAVGVGAAAVWWFGVALPYQAQRACGTAERLMAADAAGAVAVLESAVRLDSGQAACWSRLGHAAWAQASALPAGAERDRCLGTAATAFENAVGLVPPSAADHAALGKCLGDMARAQKTHAQAAYAQISRAQVLDPVNPALADLGARVALWLGDPARAAAEIQRGLERNPRSGLLVAQQGCLLIQEGKLEEGSHCLERALPMCWRGPFTDRFQAELALAACRLRCHRFQEALDLARQVVAVQPTWLQARLIVAEALLAQGDRGGAEAEYRQVLTSGGDHPAVREAARQLALLQSLTSTAPPHP